MPVPRNPFRIGAHVTGEFFTDRATEVKRVVQALRDPTRLLILGPRRMGKSSVIAVATDRARHDGVVVVRADLSTATELVDVANRLLRSLSAQRKRDRLADIAAAMAPSAALTFDEVTGVPRLVLSAERRSAPEKAQRRSLEQVFEALSGLLGRPEERVAVVLDEFQAIRRFGGESAEWHLRDLIQRHTELSVVCAGSEETLVQEMLQQERAFFRMFELLQVGPIDAGHLGTWIGSRLEAAGVAAGDAGRTIVARAGPRTQDILQVARHVYSRGLATGTVGEGSVEGAIDDVVREEDPVIRVTWEGLTAQQQNVLRAVASGADQLFSVPVREHFGLPTSSSVAAAVTALERKGIVHRDPESGRIAFDSPFTRAWVEREVLPDVPPIG